MEYAVRTRASSATSGRLADRLLVSPTRDNIPELDESQIPDLVRQHRSATLGPSSERLSVKIRAKEGEGHVKTNESDRSWEPGFRQSQLYPSSLNKKEIIDLPRHPAVNIYPSHAHASGRSAVHHDHLLDERHFSSERMRRQTLYPEPSGPLHSVSENYTATAIYPSQLPRSLPQEIRPSRLRRRALTVDVSAAEGTAGYDGITTPSRSLPAGHVSTPLLSPPLNPEYFPPHELEAISQSGVIETEAVDVTELTRDFAKTLHVFQDGFIAGKVDLSYAFERFSRKDWKMFFEFLAVRDYRCSCLFVSFAFTVSMRWSSLYLRS